MPVHYYFHIKSIFGIEVRMMFICESYNTSGFDPLNIIHGINISMIFLMVFPTLPGPHSLLHARPQKYANNTVLYQCKYRSTNKKQKNGMSLFCFWMQTLQYIIVGE